MEKLKLESKNLAAEKFAILQELFPNAVSETIIGTDERSGAAIVERAIDADILRQEISETVIEGRAERYQFSWPEKSKAILLANTPIDKTLRPIKEESTDFDNTENLYIEGDNLDVLKLLRETYLNKVKMIYIDPPYNTGNDFVYEDDFAETMQEYKDKSGDFDEEGNRLVKNLDSNGRFHTDWLNMMYPRLKLARDLLSDDGVIFISIDDYEVHNLRKICDEIFGEGNLIFQIAWRRTDNQPNIGTIARVKEYVLAYSKNIKKLLFGRLPLTEKAKNEYRYKDGKGFFRRAILLDKTRGRHKYKVITKHGNVLYGPWMIKEDAFKELDLKDGIYWTSGGDEQPYGKIYLHESKGQIPNDFWGIEFGTNQRASLEVEKLFNNRFFDFPKPVLLLKTLTLLGAESDSIILDFFSGSGTTAHSVMQLNAEDGGKRKFIMVQVPEETEEKSEAFKAGYTNICEIGKERIRRAAAKIREEFPDSAFDGGFRVLRVDSSNINDVFHSPEEYTQENVLVWQENIKSDRSAEDLLFQVMLSLGVNLSAKIEESSINDNKVFLVENSFLISCFDRQISEETIVEIAKRKPQFAVFSQGEMSDSTFTNFEQIFAQYSPGTRRKLI